MANKSHKQYAEEWGVSFSGSNPEPNDYVACKSKDDALKLMHKLAPHSVDECFQHFLSYSGFGSEPPDIVKKLRLAFAAGMP